MITNSETSFESKKKEVYEEMRGRGFGVLESKRTSIKAGLNAAISSAETMDDIKYILRKIVN